MNMEINGATLTICKDYGKGYIENWDADEYPDGNMYCMYYLISGDIPIEGINEQVWYYMIDGSNIDFSQSYTLPDEVKNLKSGTAYEGYEELCELFNKVVDAYAQS